MGLADDFTDRYEEQRLVELTNPNAPAATTIDEIFLARAIADTEAYFEMFVGVEYDGADTRHVAVAVEGVLARLQILSRTGGIGKDAKSAWKDWKEECKALRTVTARARITPVTTSTLVPSAPRSGVTERPAFDPARLRHFAPRNRTNSEDPFAEQDG